jgi:hypothetical protein
MPLNLDTLDENVEDDSSKGIKRCFLVLSWPNVKIFMVFEGLTDPYFCPHP